MDLERTARSLEALGNPVRLSVFRLLVRAGEPGLNFGQIQQLVDIPRSTLAHHINTLASAGLITQTRHGREVISRADYEQLKQALGFLTAECCQGVLRVQDADARQGEG